jgi:hypothetical protein
MMTPEEREKLEKFCQLIQEEEDPKKLASLLEELNALLDTKRERLQTKN